LFGQLNTIHNKILKELNVEKTETDPCNQQEPLFRLREACRQAQLRLENARVVNKDGDTFLEASPGAVPMTVENVKQMLEE